MIKTAMSLGAPLLGRYEGVRAGHALNNKLVRALLAEQSAWDIVSYTGEDAPVPVAYSQPAAV